MKFILFLVFIALATPSIALNSFSDDGLPDHLVGDVGLAIYATNRHLNNDSTHPLALPYAFVDCKRLFARIDEIGIKTYKMGYGYLGGINNSPITTRSFLDNFFMALTYRFK